MKHAILRLLIPLAAVVLTHCQSATTRENMHLYDLQGGRTFSESMAVARLDSARIVLVGEHHNNADHHNAQLKMIRALHRSGRKVAIGLEMFRRDGQADLDRWVGGEMTEEQFVPSFLSNWNYDWHLYRPIFAYARQHGIKMVGLNVPRKITAQVAYHGFDSLTKEQRGSLEGITCDVTPSYRAFIQKAYGAHGHGNMQFNRFCEAQMVWDSAMALHAVQYLDRHPDHVLVLLAGSGHVRKHGIPTQLAKRVPWPYAVVLPETPGIFDAHAISVEDADYLMLN